MSWTLSANGHVGDAHQELEVIEALQHALNLVGASYAAMTTSYHGTIGDLLSGPAAADSQEVTDDA